MKSKFLCAGMAVAVAMVLSGCSSPEPVPYEPVIIEHDKTLDRIHIRDDSAEFYDESRAGAAVRQDEVAQVLWNYHYVGEAVTAEEQRLLDLQRSKELEKEIAAEQAKLAGLLAEAKDLDDKFKAEREAQEAKIKAAQDKLKAEQDRLKREKDRSIYANKKDKSIYRDKSIYSKDRSIYRKDKSIYSKSVTPVAGEQKKSEKMTPEERYLIKSLEAELGKQKK